MPHEIDQTTGSAAVFVAGSPPWHGLGRSMLPKPSSVSRPSNSPVWTGLSTSGQCLPMPLMAGAPSSPASLSQMSALIPKLYWAWSPRNTAHFRTPMHSNSPMQS